MRPLLATLLLATASTLPLAAHADTLLFTLTGTGPTYTWSLPSVVDFSIPDGLGPFVSTFPITLYTNGAPSSSTVTFEQGTISDLQVAGLVVINFPYVLNPTLLSDNGTDRSYSATFDLGSFYGGAYVQSSPGVYTYDPITLTIADQSTNPTPEPSTLLLLTTGFLTALPLTRRYIHTTRT
jgi:hypothetical protein